jgi:hypothetical protein
MCGRSRTFDNCRLSSPEPFRHTQYTVSLPAHRYFIDVLVPTHRQVKVATFQSRLGSCRRLCRFRRQDTQISLVADVSQPLLGRRWRLLTPYRPHVVAGLLSSD